MNALYHIKAKDEAFYDAIGFRLDYEIIALAASYDKAIKQLYSTSEGTITAANVLTCNKALFDLAVSASYTD